MQIVYWYAYGSNGEYCVVFAPRERAEYIAAIYEALHAANTWGEFKTKLPAGEWERWIEQTYDEPPDDDQLFEADDVPGYSDRDYPPWLAQEQLSWFPDELIAKYDGEIGFTTLNGPNLNLPADAAEEIAEDLRQMGHTVEETDLEFE